MIINSNENIKEIFLEMIKEIDENSLENYVEFLKKSIRENNTNKFKENKFAITKLIELKNLREKQLAKIDDYLSEKTSRLNLVESKIKTTEKNYNKLLENYNTLLKKVEQKYSELENVTKLTENLQVAQNYLRNNCYDTEEVDEKVKFYKKSAELGNAEAQNSLGDCYYYGRGVNKDYTKAVEWYKKAAEQGYGIAQKNLGICYRYGYGVTQNLEQAIKWDKKVAEQANKYAR